MPLIIYDLEGEHTHTHIPHEKDFKKPGTHLLPARHWLPNNTRTLTITQAPIQSHPIAVI